MNYKEKAIIDSVFSGVEDHGIQTVSITMRSRAFYQAFGSLCLDVKSAKQFLDEILSLFGVINKTDLIGKECYVLRSFDGWNTPIEGLETLDGRRFTLTGFRKRYYPDAAKSPLQTKTEQLKSDIMHFTRRIKEAEVELETVKSKYVDWEKKNPKLPKEK